MQGPNHTYPRAASPIQITLSSVSERLPSTSQPSPTMDAYLRYLQEWEDEVYQQRRGNQAWADPIKSQQLTILPPAQELQFQQWVRSNPQKIPAVNYWSSRPVSPDYDLRGWYHAFMEGDPRAGMAVSSEDETLHLADPWKLSTHPSYSVESKGAMPDAPQWVGGKRLVTPVEGYFGGAI